MTNFSNLNLGTIIRLWRDSRGLDYVFVAVDETTNEALFIKANCFNQDGSIRANTRGFHKRLQFESFGDSKVVKRVTRIQGTKPVDPSVIQQHIVNYKTDSKIKVVKKQKVEYQSLPVIDARSSTVYL